MSARQTATEEIRTLEIAHCAAVEAANIAARKAYIAAFNETYDKEHRETYAVLGHPLLAVKHTPGVPASGTISRLPSAKKRAKRLSSPANGVPKQKTKCHDE